VYKCFYFGATNFKFHMTNSWNANAVYCTQSNSNGVHFLKIMLGMIMITSIIGIKDVIIK
jgi:hypothetical protein